MTFRKLLCLVFTGGKHDYQNFSSKYEECRWCAKVKPTPIPIPQPDPVEPGHPPVVSGDLPESVHVAGANVKWSVLNESATLSTEISRSGCRYTLTEDAGKWDKADGRSNGYICLIWRNPNTGKVDGEYWDGCVNANLTPYTAGWKHTQDVNSPFHGRLPKTRDKIGVVKISLYRTQRTNVSWGEWPL